MLRKLFLLIGLGSSTVVPALADIVTDVTVSGIGSGGESVTVACGNATPGCMNSMATFSSMFSQMNTQLGMFTAMGSVSTAPGFFPATISNSATQDTTATADSLSISLSGGLTANTGAPLFTWTESDSITVSFDVTELSQVKFLGGGSNASLPNAGELLDANGNVILTIPNSPLGVSLDLEPGMYQLKASDQGGGQGNFSQPTSTTDFVLGLSANFSPVATPEPRTASFAALLAIVLGGYLPCRLRRKVTH